MKHTILVFIFLSSINSMINAQAYSFDYNTGPYTDLVGGISLNNDSTWDDPQYTVPLGFNFELAGATHSELYIGGIGAFLTTELFYYYSESSLVVPFNSDLADRGYDPNGYTYNTGSLSPITYLTDGPVGDRITKIEWNNAGFYDDLDADGVSIDYVNLQIWLYEGSNVIEYHYGPNSITQLNLAYADEPGPIVGVIPGYDGYNDELTLPADLLLGDPTAPTAIVSTTFDSIYTLIGNIPEGMIYTFSPLPVNTKDQEIGAGLIELYPNPVNHELNIGYPEEIKIDQISITNNLGQQVGQFDSNETVLDVFHLAPGTYFLHITPESGAGFVNKFVKYDNK